MSVLTEFRRSILFLGALSLCVTFTACDDDEGGGSDPDVTDGETTEVTCEDAAQTESPIQRSPSCNFEDRQGWDPETAVPVGEVRAGQVRNDVRPFSGPEARCGLNDWIIENEHIRVCISDDSTNQLFFSGGRIIDIEDPAIPGNEFMEFGATSFGLSEITGDNIELLSVGDEGGDAVLRVTGIDMPLKLEIGSLGSSILTGPAGIEIETEYRLGPDSRTLEVVTWYNTTAGAVSAEREIGEIMFPGDTATYVNVPYGLGTPATAAPVSMFASITDAMSYGVFFDEGINGKASTGSSNSGILSSLVTSLVAINAGTYRVAPDNEMVYRRWYAVGGPNTTDVQDAFATLEQYTADDAADTTITLTADNDFAQNAQWLVAKKVVLIEGEPAEFRTVGVVSINDDGTGSINLEDGEYRTTPISWPTMALGDVEFTVPDDASVTLPSPDAGYVAVTVTDDSGTNEIPAQVRFIGDGVFTEFRRVGDKPFEIPVGTWDLEVSRGEEMSLVLLDDVVVTKGEETAVNAQLTREMDTASWVSGDLHQHANRSPDSEVPAVDRAMANLVAGVDFFAPSDHDMIEDFTSIVASLGEGNQIHVLQGEEISPIRAHMNVFPIPYVHADTAGGAVPQAERSLTNPREGRQLTQPEMAAEARSRGAEMIQINHARGSLAYFDTVGYDPVSGEPTKRLEQWFDAFEAMEVFNEFDEVCVLMQDWFSFLAHGKSVAGLGNSDTHNLGSQSGYPRNYLFVGSDAEDSITDDVLVEAINAGRVSVSGGLFLDFTDGTRPGDTVSTNTGVYDANLRIQSPSWTSATTLVTFVNGLEVDRTTITADDEDIVDFDDVVSVNLTEDSFVVFLAFSFDAMDAVTPNKRPFGMTNPIYVDVDGGGYEAPAAGGADAVVAQPDNLPWCNQP